MKNIDWCAIVAISIVILVGTIFCFNIYFGHQSQMAKYNYCREMKIQDCSKIP